MQKLTEDAKAILLLCGRFGKSDAADVANPLSLGEYNRLADWMLDHNIRPSDLLAGAIRDTAAETKLVVDSERIHKLLSRGATMALTLEKWIHNGIWILCRSDELYPGKLKEHLKRKQAPPVLFGVGDMGLLSEGGLAVVGSRNVDDSVQTFTRKVGETCARDGMQIVSGGARGVDQIAMLSALHAGGKVVGILADGLYRASVAGKYRTGIRGKRLVLVSPFHPESRFTVGNAMGRNKLMYALADFALVVSAEKDKGGTWTGAKEELNRPEPKPVFVRLEEKVPEGNRALLKLGARPFPETPWKDNLRKLLENARLAPVKKMPSQGFLFDEPGVEPVAPASIKEEKGVYEDRLGAGAAIETGAEPIGESLSQNAYEAVLPVLLKGLQDWKVPKELAEELEVRKVQLDDWIKRALKEGHIEKKNRPVRYRRK